VRRWLQMLWRHRPGTMPVRRSAVCFLDINHTTSGTQKSRVPAATDPVGGVGVRGGRARLHRMPRMHVCRACTYAAPMHARMPRMHRMPRHTSWEMMTGV
jgi:hypothetical protein